MFIALLATAVSCQRTIYSLDLNWKFELQSDEPLQPCASDTWTIDLKDKSTDGLVQAPQVTEERCAEACCNDVACGTYQFCNSSTCGSGPPQQPSCWIGAYSEASTRDNPGWTSKARIVDPPSPSPSPSPGPSACTENWCTPSTDDSQWRSLDVPHDFVVEGNFTESASMSQGFLPFGIGYYRKHLSLPSNSGLSTETHSVYLEFDGAQTVTDVYLEGQYLGSHSSGYTPFSFQLTDSQVSKLLQPNNGDMVLAVKVDATVPDSWWYDGGGKPC